VQSGIRGIEFDGALQGSARTGQIASAVA
jgi:hypothetical protein